MKAVRLIEPQHPLQLQNIPTPIIGANDVLVQSKGRRNLPYRRTLQSRQIPSASIAKNTWP